MENITIGNQQETKLGYLAGLIDGEGSLGITKLELKTGRQYRIYCDISNTDLRIINWTIKFCEDNKISVYVREYQPKKPNHRKQYNVRVTGLQSMKRFLEIVKDYLVAKKDVAEYLLSYLRNRVEKLEKHKQDRNVLTGRFTNGSKAKYDKEDEKTYQEFRILRDFTFASERR